MSGEEIERDIVERLYYGAGSMEATEIVTIPDVADHREAAAEIDRLRTQLAELTRERDHLMELLKPFAAEGQKWLGTPSGHDGLKLLCGEDYGFMNHHSREAEFTIGDLKRAALRDQP